MKVWQLKVSTKSMELTYIDENYDEISMCSDNFKGESMQHVWKIMGVEVYKKGLYRDVAIFGRIPALSTKIEVALKGFLGGRAELLDIYVADAELEMKLLNVISVVDALDSDRSVLEVNKFGHITGDKGLFFNKERIEGIDIFKVPEFKRRIFVSDDFRDHVIKTKIKGFEFEEVWDSEFTVEMEQQLQQQYEDALAQVEAYSGPTVDWEEAYRQVIAGKAIASGEWKIQLDQDNNLVSGRLSSGGQHSWIVPIYIPPILLDLRWHEVEKSEL